jgi:hypothetical protein
MKGSGNSSWRQSRKARQQLNFTSRQLVRGAREWKVWFHVFDNMARLEGSSVKGFRSVTRWLSGYPRKRGNSGQEINNDSD